MQQTRTPLQVRISASTAPWLLLLLSLFGLVGTVNAGEVAVGWDQVSDPRVAVYQVHYGLQSLQYDSQVETASTSVTITGLQDGETHYFAVRACDESRLLCSDFSDELAISIPIPPTTPAPPVADFLASTQSGSAPLSVLFTDASTGDISTYAWDFGDGGTGTAPDAVYTYSLPGTYTVSLTVTGSGGSDTEVKVDYINVLGAAPTADFAADVTAGSAPLSVQFADLSDGLIDTWLWDFGDGTTSGDREPLHVYADAGSYSVTLSVSGPSGTDTVTKSDFVVATDPVTAPPEELPLEIGEVQLDHTWRWIDFQNEFLSPIVIFGPPGANESDPAIVRVGAVYTTGCWVRLQEWDYLDDYHAEETVGYMVVEQGVHQLPDGTWMEADRVQLKSTSTFVGISFEQPFADSPVVLTTVTTANETDAVTTQMENVDANGFDLMLREQEASTQWHRRESIDYVALLPSTGTLGGLAYEAGRTGDAVTDAPFTLTFGSAFDAPPVVLARSQTTNGSDTASLRWSKIGDSSIELWVDEEQSLDSETSHVAESVGYFAIGAGAAVAAEPVILLRVNAGGPLIAAIDGGIDWAADTKASPHPYHNPGSYTAEGDVRMFDSSVDLATTPIEVFATERWDPPTDPEMEWDVPLDIPIGTTLEVRLYFGNGCYCATEIGARVFDVKIDGVTVLDDYDIIADVGDQTGVMKSFTVTYDGNVDIDFRHLNENPLIRGIEILALD